jgi:hypothetical protein
LPLVFSGAPSAMLYSRHFHRSHRLPCRLLRREMPCRALRAFDAF